MAILMKDKLFFGFSAQDSTFVIEYVKDFSPRRAAECAGYAPEHGQVLMKRDDIIECIRKIVEERMTEMNIDAEWLLYELVDNHRIARQHGNISASNTALGTIAKHVTVDALAKQRIEIDDVSDRQLTERLMRGRKRMNDENEKEISFL